MLVSKKNIIALFLTKLAEFAIPIIIFPILARNLGVSHLGSYSIIQVIISFIFVFLDYGYSVNGVRLTAILKDNFVELGKFVQKALMLRGAIGLIAYALSLIVMYIFFRTSFNLDVGIFLFFAMLSMVINLGWLFQGLEIIKRYAFLLLIIRLISVIPVILLIKSPDDFILSLWLSNVANVSGGIYTLFVLKRQRVNILGSVRFAEVIEEFKSGWHFFVPSIYSIFLTGGGVLALGVYQPPATVGGYAAMERLVKAVLGVTGVINQVVYPRVASLAQTSHKTALGEIRRNFLFFMPIIFLITLSLIVFGPFISNVLYGEKYDKFTDVLRYLPFYILFASVNTFIGVIYMSIFNFQKIYSKIFMIGTIFAVLIYTSLPNVIGYHAPALGLVVSEAVITLLISLFIIKKRGSYV